MPGAAVLAEVVVEVLVEVVAVPFQPAWPLWWSPPTLGRIRRSRRRWRWQSSTRTAPG